MYAQESIAGSYGSSIFSFLRNSILFSIVAAPIYIPTSSVGEPPWKVIISSILTGFETLLRQNI